MTGAGAGPGAGPGNGLPVGTTNKLLLSSGSCRSGEVVVKFTRTSWGAAIAGCPMGVSISDSRPCLTDASLCCV